MTIDKNNKDKPVAPVKKETKPVAPVTQLENQTVVTREPENNVWKILGIIGLVLLLGLALFGLFRLFGGGTNSAITDADANPPVVVAPAVESELAHLAYWSSATEKDRWPDMKQFNIIACHNDPDAEGNAKVVFLIGEDIQVEDLQLIYYNGYTGVWSDQVKSQIITEIQDSVRPHIPGFTLTEVEILHVQ
jgi:hypothetical protein